MIKSATIGILLLLSISSLNAQWQYANEWIEEIGYDKSFYHFEVNEEGIIQIPAEALSETNLPVEHAQWRVFARGEEIAIRVVAEGPNLEAGDYIEFYAQGNDGYFDEQLYESTAAHTTPDLSLFNDAISYYITWSEEGTGMRFQEIENEIDSSMEPLDYFMHTSKVLPNSTYYGGESFELADAIANYSDFEEGEGFVSNLITKDSPISFDIATKSVYQEAGVEAEIEFKIMGREDDPNIILDHFIEVSLEEELYLEAIYDGFLVNTYEFPVDLADLGPNETEITFNPTGNLCDDCDDRNSLAYINLTYPHSFNLENKTHFHISLANNDSEYIVAENFNGSSENTILYDLTNNWFLTAVEAGDNYEFMLPAGADTESERDIYINNLASINTNTIDTLAPITFTDFSQESNQGDYIIIFHPSLNDAENEELPVSQYAAYRGSEQGGSYEVVMVSIDQLYHQFGHGIAQHPQAIRHFINEAVDNWTEEPAHLFLIGKAIDYATAHFNEDQAVFNLLPTYGFPSSDNSLTSCCTEDYRPRLTVGRISALNSTDVSHYLSKITAHESLDWAADSCNIDYWTWPKKMLNLGRVSTIDDSPEDGIADDLLSTSSYLDNIKANVEGDSFKGEELARLIEIYEFPGSAITPIIPTTNEYDNVLDILSEGVGLINLVEGDYTNGLWGMTNFELSPSIMGIDAKYPAVFSMANFIGDFTNSTSNPSLGESLVLAPNSGAVSYLGSVSFDYKEHAAPYLEDIYEQLTNELANPLMGAAIQQAIAANYVDIMTDPEAYTIAKVMSQVYHFEGDPVVRISNADLPDYNFEDVSTDLVFEPSFLTTDLESYTLKVTAHNPGVTIVDELLVLKIQRTNALGTTYTLTEAQVAAPVNDTTYVFEFEMDDSYAGQNTFSVQINHNLAAAETCYDNNLMVSTQIVDSPLIIAPEYECVDSMIQCNVLINGGVPPYQLSSTPDLTITDLAFNIFQFQPTEDFSLTVLDANNESFTLGPISLEAEDPCAPPITIEEADFAELKIAPNPTADYIQISWGAPIDQLHLSLYDAKGQQLIEKMIQNHENLGLEDLASGVYFLNLQAAKHQILRKIIKE